MATLSILGLYNYDNTLFDNMSIPDGVNKDVLVENLVIELAEFEILYPDAVFMKSAIEIWSKKQIYNWNKLNDTLNFDYDPISNYDRNEETTNTETRNLKNESTQTDNRKSEQTNSGTDIEKNSGLAFNDSAPTQRSQTEFERGVKTELQNSGGVTSEFKDSGTKENKVVSKISGNVGVTTTQHMIEEERAVVKFNIYDYIINEFKNRFCLLVY